MTTGLRTRFLRQVDISDGCWEWKGSRAANGYGRIREAGRGSRTLLAHRAAWLLFGGTIPAGKEIDHKCRNRGCVNPAHLEVVSHAENMRRARAAKTSCKRGHVYSPETTSIDRNGHRSCRVCRRDAQRAYEARRAA